MKKSIAALFFCVLLIMSLTGCGTEKSQDTAKALLVKTQTIALGGADSEGNYPGVVKGRYETNMSFQVGGRILQRYIQPGDRVQAGDVLMSIDNRDVLQQANQGSAQAAAAKAQLELSRSNLNRYSILYAQDAVPASVLEQYQTAYDAALAAYNQAAAGAAQGHNALGYASLIAASDGVIAAVSAEAGQVVGAGQTVLTLVQSQELEVEVNLPESRISSVSVGQKVPVAFWSLNSQRTEGTIREISPMADSTARTYRIRISLPQPPSGLHLGMTASAGIGSTDTADGQQEAFALLPLAAVYQTGDTPNVWLVNPEDMTLSLKPVQVEDFSRDKLKVTGLKTGDIVVTAGVHKLREGILVRLAEAEE